MVMRCNRSTARKHLCAVALAAQIVVSVGANAMSREMSSAQCGQPLAQRLIQAALASPAAVQEDGSLYGVQRWTAGTRASYLGLQFPGLLSCA